MGAEERFGQIVPSPPADFILTVFVFVSREGVIVILWVRDAREDNTNICNWA